MARRSPSPELSRLLARGKARLLELFARQPRRRPPVTAFVDEFGCPTVADVVLVEDVDDAGELVLRAISTAHVVPRAARDVLDAPAHSAEMAVYEGDDE